MRVVQRPSFKPQRCAAIPFIGAHSQAQRWIDTGSEMEGFGNRVYLSETAVREAATLLGFPEKGALKDAQARIAVLESKLADEQEHNKQLASLVEAMATVQEAGMEVTTNA